MKHLLEHWGEVEGTLTPNFLLLTDYDGTLTPIVERPQDATMSEDMRALLKRLVELSPVCVVSGRALANLKETVGVDGIYYAGNHGFEIEGPGVELTKPEAERARPAITEICSKLAHRLRHIGGMLVEDKGLTGSVHYRMVADDRVQELKEIFSELVEPRIESGEIMVTRGKKVLELRPNVDWGKGETVRWLVDVIGKERGEVYPIYMGDDTADEEAFRALKAQGLSVLVDEERESAAEYFLRNVNEVKEFLEKLIFVREK